ncbi:hypothetical protein [Saccharothrix algeriensis]|uniref:PPE family domain-containing protein n=3 Tax=Saccharothrix algeriensis TaxID=173560 RepID=A0ABS2SA00_9PSEU|nr:hypothetical protein [Saccharothrix algeriensis]MBM7812474.1 hypothetical protein [Saccharothrix algeriensis]
MAPPDPQNPNATKVDYVGQTEAELRAEYDRKVQENPGFGNVVPNFLAYLDYKSESARHQAQQERQLEQVVEDYRPPMSTAGSFYLGYPHDQLKSMVTDNMAPSTADEQGEAWTKIGNTLVDLQDNLTKATEASKGAWQGAAASAAQGYFTDMAAWSGNAAQGAQLTGNKLYEQSQAAETAKSAMPEPVQFSTADAYKMFFSEPNPFKWAETIDKIEQKFEEKQQAHERAAEVMTTMSTSFQETGSTMPAFAPPPTMEGSGGTGDSTNPNQTGVGGRPTVPDAPGGGTGVTGIPGPGGGGKGGGNTNQSGWTPGGGPGGGPGGIPGPGPGPGGGGWQPGPAPIPGPVPGPGPGPRPGPGNRPPTGPRPPGVPIGRPGPGGGPGGRGLPGGGGPGGGSGGGRGGLGGGPGGLGGLGGPGGSAAAGRGGFGPGGSSGMLGEAGRSGAGGFGPSGSGGPGGAAAGRGGAAAGMGMGGMGAGAGRGQGEEDKEHKAASYLVETEDVFGDGTMVAPPVIGG